MKNVVAVVVMGFAMGMSGCATNGMLDQMQRSVAEHQKQAQVLAELYKDPENKTDEGTLKVPAVVTRVDVIEVQKASTTAQAVAGPFGTVAKLGAAIVDSSQDGETVTAKQYQLRTANGVTFVTTQPKGSEYQADFEKGQKVLYLSTRPVTEGQNVFYIQAR